LNLLLRAKASAAWPTGNAVAYDQHKAKGLDVHKHSAAWLTGNAVGNKRL
jgi:hypothetical protein